MAKSASHVLVQASSAAGASHFAPLVETSVAGHGRPALVKAAPRRAGAVVEKAVYAHIRAMRTLGHTTANTEQIAKALDLSRREVEAAVRGMESRGVKVVR